MKMYYQNQKMNKIKKYILDVKKVSKDINKNIYFMVNLY